MSDNRGSITAWLKFLLAAAVVSIGGLLVLGTLAAFGINFEGSALLFIVVAGLLGLNWIGRRLGVAR